MTESIMLINETDDECRIAVVESGILQEMLIEHTHAGQTKNNIYKGVVVQVQTSLQAAFVEYGDKKHGFLPNSELNPILFKGKKQRKHEPIQHKIKVGDEVLVQVTREASSNKGAALSTYITLPGRFMVLMPYSDKGGVSKKIDEAEERDRLKGFLSGIESEEHAVIIRTAGLGRSLSELKKDYTTLKKKWNEIWATYEKLDKTGLIIQESDVVTRTLRDYYTDEIKEVWVDNPVTFQNALAFFKEVAPRKQKDLKLFVDDRSLFATYHIERQVEQLTSKQIKLQSGGSIVIDQTEALVAIDVNSGRSNQEGNIDSTALRTNLEAAEEIARQLRLRNLGGLIVIDFIDMENEQFRKQVEDKLSEAMRKDKAQLRFNPISQFGLLELSRQRLSVGISSTVERTCPVCQGKGKVPSILASTNLIIRSIRELAAKGNVSRIEGDLPLELVNILLNDRRQSISDLELEFDIDIALRGNPELTVFNERFLNAVFDKKAKQREVPQKRVQDKNEHSKKRPQKQNLKKDAGPQKQNASQQDFKQGKEPSSPEEVNQEKAAESAVQEVPEKTIEPIETVEKVHQIPPKKQAKDSSRKQKSRKKDKENVGNFGIHPSCLFTDVKELEDNELVEVTASFENRLKGKIDNIPPQFIDDKYLWKSQNGKNEDEPKAENNAEPVGDSSAVEAELPENDKAVKTKKTGRRRSSRKTGRSTEKVAKKSVENTATDDVSIEESESKKKSTKTASTAKRNSARTSAKSKQNSSARKGKASEDTKSTTSKSNASQADKKSKKIDSEVSNEEKAKSKKPVKKASSTGNSTAGKGTKKKAETGKKASNSGSKSEISSKKQAKVAKEDSKEKSTKSSTSKGAKKVAKKSTTEKTTAKSAARKKPATKAKKS